MKKPHKHKDLIIAWANGAYIEVYNEVEEEWELSRPMWHEHHKYRIKPQPKLVPFDTKADAEKLIGKAVVGKEKGNIFLITGVSKFSEEVRINDYWVAPEYLLKDYTFLDGSPCGKYVQE